MYTCSQIQREKKSNVSCAISLIKRKELRRDGKGQCEHFFPGHQDMDDVASKQSELQAIQTLDTARSWGSPVRELAKDLKLWLTSTSLSTNAKGAGKPASVSAANYHWPRLAYDGERERLLYSRKSLEGYNLNKFIPVKWNSVYYQREPLSVVHVLFAYPVTIYRSILLSGIYLLTGQLQSGFQSNHIM